MDDLLNEFLSETAESMDVLDVELVKLEQNPNDKEILSNVFRLVHTIKGTCGFLGLPRLESVSHASENVLGKIRDDKLSVSVDGISLILEGLDRIKGILADLEATEVEPEGDDGDLIGRLNHLATTGDVIAGSNEDGRDADTDTDADADADADEEEDGENLTGSLDIDVEESEDVIADPPELLAAFASVDYSGPGDPMAMLKKNADGPHEATSNLEPDEAESDVVSAKTDVAKVSDRSPSTGVGTASEDTVSEKKDGGIAAQTIRVNVDLLENLMTMVSELVLTRNQLLQMLREQGDSDFDSPLQRLSYVTTELQEGVMKTRMQPIGNAWTKLPRLVRDLSVDLNKKIDLRMIGSETELDRQVSEIIKDPLTHMVRNSGDHGIESPRERVAAGKPETGTITLNAYHEGGYILIEISDDGRGLNMERIREKVVANGLVSEDLLASMSDHQVQQFVFHPGFSTAEVVTSVSGRGVGMDVVKTNIEKIGGTINLRSVEGRGTLFTIKIPLTLAIISALIVNCAGERFAIPQLSVVELVRISGDEEHVIETIHGTPVLRLRNQLLPLINLQRLLALEEGQATQDLSITDECYVVVCQVGSSNFGLIVDRIYDAEEIVVKPVATLLRDLSVFGGNTILGDGSVVLILDANGIANSTGISQVSSELSQTASEEKTEEDGDRTAFMLFRAGGPSPMAVPLALVARLEELDFETVELANGRAVVQYRGGLMPLVSVSEGYEFPEEGKRPILVFSDKGRSLGLVVDEIIDIVEDRLVVELSGNRPGLIGSAVIAGKATDIIDTAYYLTQNFADWFVDSSVDQKSITSTRRRILLVDDSAFFRNLLAPVLSAAGYNVKSAVSAEEALLLMERRESFDGIVSDIEMQGMNGFEFVETLRQGSTWADVPVVALSSHANRGDVDRGLAAGFTDYVAKHDRDRLLEVLAKSLDDTARDEHLAAG